LFKLTKEDFSRVEVITLVNISSEAVMKGVNVFGTATLFQRVSQSPNVVMACLISVCEWLRGILRLLSLRMEKSHRSKGGGE
jgi:hypothetical protein